MDAMLTTKEAADQLDAQESTVRNWYKAGRFPGAKKHGERCILIPQADVDTFRRLKNRRRAHRTPAAP